MSLHSLLFAAVLASTTTPNQSASPSEPYGVLTLPSGHSYRVLNSGPMVDDKGKQLALALSYVSTAQTQSELDAAGRELFEYLRPHAEHEKQAAVVVIARLGSGADAVNRDTLYEREPSGGWKRAARGGDPLPRNLPPPPPDDRDVAAQRAASAEAEAWLALLDGGRFEESWAEAAPFLQERAPRGTWMQSGESMKASLGKRLARKQVALLETANIPSGPTGRYVVVEYQSKFARKPVAFESVTEMLCDDGKWRVAGYAVR